ncbi:MAG: hypothetical protein BWY75_01633 [bacterium ADurb.Bin425]|nr:MAG: hypothetical protein BWY75_01633 [bacterium ADurb.Bin425]
MHELLLLELLLNMFRGHASGIKPTDNRSHTRAENHIHRNLFFFQGFENTYGGSSFHTASAEDYCYLGSMDFIGMTGAGAKADRNAGK